MLSEIRDLCAAAGAAYAAERTAEGLALAERAVDLCSRSLGTGHYAYLHSLMALGWLEHQGGRPEAASRFAEAVARAQLLASSDFENAVVVMTQALRFWGAVGQPEAARQLRRQLADLHTVHLGPEHPRTHQQRAAVDGAETLG